MKKLIFLLAVFAVNTFAGTLFTEDFEKGLGKRWEPVKFEGITQYSVIRETTNSFLQARAVSSASGLGVKVNAPVKPNTSFSWRWKVDKTPAGGSEDVKKSFDHTVRLFVAFQTSLGPPRTINYVWANKLATGKTFHHPSSNRARFVVLESGDSKKGEWVKESRDLFADWKQLFGNDEPPNIVSIGLMTDSDGTKSTVTGFYDDLKIVAP
jgi:hypothetical protein